MQEEYDRFWSDTEDSLARSERLNFFILPKDRWWREKKEEAENAKLVIARLHEQLTQLPSVRSRAFTYGYVVGILKLKNHLLANPRADLNALDQSFFAPDPYSLRRIDPLGRTEMPDAFLSVAPSTEPCKDGSSSGV